jgi:hypothetical protein
VPWSISPIELALALNVKDGATCHPTAVVDERDGHRAPLLAAQAGDIELKIPELPHGTFLPTCCHRAGGSIRRCMR